MPETIPLEPFGEEPSQAPSEPKLNIVGLDSLAPQTNAALQGISPDRPVSERVFRSEPKPDLSEAGFVSRNEVGGVPLDTRTGVPSWDYFRASLDRLKQNQLNYYKSKGYPVRLSDTGEIIVRVADSKTGKPKDVLANPHGMDLNDFMDIAVSAPEIAAGFLSARKGNVRGAGQTLINVLRMAAGSQLAGAGKDIGVRAARGEDIAPGELFTSRAEMAAADVAMGTAIAGATKVATKLVSPFSEKGPLQFNLEKARAHFASKGYDLHSTPGETTGNPFLLRMEAFARQNPGSSVPFDKMAVETANDVQRIQNVMLGLPEAATEAEIAAMPTAEQVGEKTIGAIGSKNLQLERQVGKAKSEMGQAATADIKGAFGTLAGGPARSLSDLGKRLSTKIQSDFSKFKADAEANYQKVESNPLVKEKNILADDLAHEAQSLYEKLPSVEKTISTETGLLDQFNNPIMRDEKGKQVLWEFVPAGIKSKLERLRGLEGQSFRLDELLSMRRELRNSINQAQAIPGVQTRYLSQMEDMVDSRIRNGLKDLDPQLLKDWEAANDAYASGIKKFKEHGIANALKTPEQPGFIGPRELANRAVKDPDWLAAYKGYFGAGSPEYAQVKRAILDDMATLDPITGTINGAEFFRNLTKMAKDNPEVLKEVMGSSGRWSMVVKLGKLQEYSQTKEPLRIDSEELSKVLGTGSLTEQKFTELIAAESKRAVAYQNRLRKSVSAGSLDPDSINPADFTRYMSQTARPSEIRDVMALISDRPEVLEDIRRSTVEQVLNDASSSPKALEVISTQGRVSKELTASGLEDALKIGDRVAEARFKSILGQETWDDLVSLRDFLRPRELKQAAFQTAGGLSAGAKIAALEHGKILRFADTAIKNFIFATIYTSRPLKAWAANNLVSGSDAAAAVNYMVASTPFIESLTRQFGDRAVDEAKNVKAAIDAYVQSQKGNAGTKEVPSATRKIDLEKF